MPRVSITLMAKNKQRLKNAELDSVYALKLAMYLIIGTLWVRIEHGSISIPLPVGLVLGVLFAMHDHFKIDRKIEYAVLLIAMLVGFWSQIGLMITY